jgi:hypothetical protein
VVGAWNGDGKTTIGVVDPRTMTWYLRDSNTSGAPDIAPFQYGGVGWLPVAGDWNGDGTTTIGVVDRATMTWYLRNENSAGLADAGIFAYGGAGWLPLGGPRIVAGWIELATRSEAPATPSSGTAASFGIATRISDGVPALPGEQALRPWSVALSSGTPAVRHASRAGQVRTAALDELFTTGLE